MINYYLLTKPGIILGNLVTVAAGFILGSGGHINFLLFLYTLLGITFVMASACVFNNYIDCPLDKKMNRTKNRALVIGLITGPHALLFGSILGLLGLLTLAVFTNMLTVAIAGIGFFVYVVLYSFWKGKTVYGTAIGSIAGAVPPVIGYCAASERFDAAAIILFAMLVLWQMPHFFAIALQHMEDYKRANIPTLPIVKGAWMTKIHMLLYIMAFVPLTMALTLFGYTGLVYLIVAPTISIAWMILCISGFKTINDQRWGRQMFQFSLAVILVICTVIPLDMV